MAVLSKPTFPLMKLPAELRVWILEYLLLSPTPIVDLQKGVVSTAVLQVCKQLNAEGHPILAKNIFRFTATETMVSLLRPIARPVIQYIELDHVHVQALHNVDEQTYAQLGQGSLATLLTVPGHPSEFSWFTVIGNMPYEQYEQVQQIVQQVLQPSKVSYMHHAGREYLKGEENWVLQGKDVKVPNVKGFTLDVGPNFTSWLLVKYALPRPLGALIKAFAVMTLYAAIFWGRAFFRTRKLL